MSEAPFHTTRMGMRFYDKDVPALVKALERIADVLEDLNRQKPEPDRVDPQRGQYADNR